MSDDIEQSRQGLLRGLKSVFKFWLIVGLTIWLAMLLT